MTEVVVEEASKGGAEKLFSSNTGLDLQHLHSNQWASQPTRAPNKNHQKQQDNELIFTPKKINVPWLRCYE